MTCVRSYQFARHPYGQVRVIGTSAEHLAIDPHVADLDRRSIDPVRKLSFLAGLLVLAASARPASAMPPPPAVTSVCATIATAAGRYRLPVAYVTRLIWQESRFDANALSPSGAQGVAQFMPKTAAGRGLVDPFSTPEAIDQSAAYLDELRRTFGNLGLAAAAYNAGPGRVSRWLAGQVDLPGETLAYVGIVTGHAVAEWRAAPVPVIDTAAMFSCPRFVAQAGPAAASSGTPAAPPPGKAWAVVLLGNPQRDRVLAEYDMLRGQFSKILGGVQPSVVHKRIGGLQVARYIVQVERDTRGGANDFCGRLQRAGGNCIVLANRR